MFGQNYVFTSFQAADIYVEFRNWGIFSMLFLFFFFFFFFFFLAVSHLITFHIGYLIGANIVLACFDM